MPICVECQRDRPKFARGFCQGCYDRGRRSGAITRIRRRYADGAVCSVDGCTDKPHGRGICSNHYNQQFGKDRSRKYKYGVDDAKYAEMLAQQNGVCAICSKPETRKYGHGRRHGKVATLAVDHIRGTKIVRGLLCASCNTGIGMLCHQPEILRKAADYLECLNQSQFPPAGLSAGFLF